jgi:TolB-like protein/Flp pilus assembly protein TadD
MRHRHRQIIQQEHKNFNGRIIHYYGDGTLSTFQSIIEAVQCALSMQQQFLQAPSIPVRMGLHVGDIIFKDDEIIGDGVNLASRIESLGVSGSVLISDKANEELHNHPSLKTISVGVYALKNIKRDVEVFALNHEGLVIPRPNSLNGKTKQIDSEATSNNKPDLDKGTVKSIPLKSVVVLPFVNIGNNTDQEYFSDGMAEEIINALTNLEDLKVAGRTSSFQFKNKDVDLRELGKKLGVCTVLSGSVRRQGNWLRITAQLINIEDGYQMWSEKYDRELDNVFAIQDDIALAITKKLKLTLFKKDHELITKSPTKNTEAYELYLKGKFYVNRRGAWIITALECFQQAVALDPEFALAHAACADANLLITSYGLMPTKNLLEQAKQSAEKAITLDPTLSQPYCALGYYYACSEWNWAQAKENFLKSISLNPRYAEGHFRYAWNYLACVEGKFEEAEKHATAAIQQEPLSSLCYAMYAFILQGAGKFDEALNASKTGIELDANSFLCWVNAGVSQLALGQYEYAILSFESALSLSAKQIMPIHGLIWVYCLTGRKDQGYLLMNKLKEKSKGEYVAPTFTAISAAYLNELEEAFDYLEKAYAERDPAMLVLKHARWVPLNLRKDSRYQSLLSRIGFGQ